MKKRDIKPGMTPKYKIGDTVMILQVFSGGKDVSNTQYKSALGKCATITKVLDQKDSEYFDYNIRNKDNNFSLAVVERGICRIPETNFSQIYDLVNI